MTCEKLFGDGDQTWVPEEEYGLQKCAELPAERQVLNAENYAIYASGRCWVGGTSCGVAQSLDLHTIADTSLF